MQLQSPTSIDATVQPVNQQAIEGRPWDRPAWKPTKGKGAIFSYLVLIHVLAIIGLILFPIPSLAVFVSALILVALGGLGTTVGYHRTLSHRTLQLNRAVEQVLIFCAMFNGSGAPRSWVAYHRHHHAKVDTPEDSQNVWWLGPLQLAAWGENWHRNHHSNAGSARFGLRWWQVDVGWYFIRALEMIGLARKVRRPRVALLATQNAPS